MIKTQEIDRLIATEVGVSEGYVRMIRLGHRYANSPTAKRIVRKIYQAKRKVRDARRSLGVS